MQKPIFLFISMTESQWEKPGGFQGASSASVPPPVNNFVF